MLVASCGQKRAGAVKNEPVNIGYATKGTRDTIHNEFVDLARVFVCYEQVTRVVKGQPDGITQPGCKAARRPVGRKFVDRVNTAGAVVVVCREQVSRAIKSQPRISTAVCKIGAAVWLSAENGLGAVGSKFIDRGAVAGAVIAV